MSDTIQSSISTSQPQNLSKNNQLPLWKLIALSAAGFVAIMTETMPAGLLIQISRDLQVSEALVGQLITLFAIGAMVSAIPLIALTRSWGRKKVFILALAGLFLFNTITALSTNYVLTLIVRFGAGMSIALIWGLFAGYARRMVPQHLQGRALAIAGVGQPLALSLGVPLGTWLGKFIEWQMIFGLISMIILGLIIWMLFLLPDFPGQAAAQRKSLRQVFVMPGVRPILFVLFVWVLAHNILYTYIAPFMAHAGLANRLDIALLVFGISSLVGIWITGLFIDGRLRTLTLISLASFAVAALVLGIFVSVPLLIYIGIAAWGLTFGGGPTLLQTAIADTAEENADVAMSMFVTVFNLSIAAGGMVGGLLLDYVGAGTFPWALVLLSLIGLFTVWRNRKHAFIPDQK
ncbi:Predicted arabinose efflux permease, MFS family [Seinonella peptonophila]|uniref:Predicted arabinose efflux permease, MFS family n=1 Tax=Seinonella peptonophila TaxID=112248 RepID=A0A1M4Z8S8_9BACL|nr:MFS transporter [Seinonella peptonophila]SHF14431.1 Predicted arabinose efflux permease, MFS family [Seinonella peptonophila]